MGVFKWLRRERVTVTTNLINSGPSTPEEQEPPTHIGTIRTEEYKRDLAEFQARRSSGQRELQETPVKKKCGRHSLPVSCTDCTGDPDTTFNYEKKSAIKYKKKNHKHTRNTRSEEKADGVPSIQFLFQNQVFMPGNLYGQTSFSEPHKSKRHSRQSARRSPEMDLLIQRQIDFKEDCKQDSSPLFYKNNSLPFDVRNFLNGPRSEEDVLDGSRAEGDVKSSQSSSDSPKGVRSDEKLWEVISELKQFDRWADEQLQPPSGNTTKSDDTKSDTSLYGLPVAMSSSVELSAPRRPWSSGQWGAVPVQVKNLPGVTLQHVKRKLNTEINILRNCRHPNIILLMGLFPDVRDDVNIICERCVDTLHGIIHVQGRILTAQASLQYALELSDALLFLRMRGYIHSALCSAALMLTAHDTVKLADLSPCAKLPIDRTRATSDKGYEVYSPEPQYVNIEDTRESSQGDCEPLLSTRSSEAYISANAVPKDYKLYCQAEHYRWQAPELFEPNDEGMVFPCSKSDVYSLFMILWECCNASLPHRALTYEQLRAHHSLLWRGGACGGACGVRLPADGAYPGCLLAVLRAGLACDRAARPDLAAARASLADVKSKLDEMEYIIIPARLSKKKSDFTVQSWDTASPTDSECQSPKRNIEHEAIVHTARDSSTGSEKDCSKSEGSPLYETIRKTHSTDTFEKRPESDEDPSDGYGLSMKYDTASEKECCSTPLAKLRAGAKGLESPGVLHRSDSTEYCSILSPDVRAGRFAPNDVSNKDQSSAERPTAKLSRSFTPKSYKPLHIKVPEFNLDSVKTLLKDRNSNERSSYNFDIKNYSLPTTPIARSNKLRKNAWLSGDLNLRDRSNEKLKDAGATTCEVSGNENEKCETFDSSTGSSSKDREADARSCRDVSAGRTGDGSPGSADTVHNCFTGFRRASVPQDASPPARRPRAPEDALAHVSVKPLVAIHERWIHDANRKSGRAAPLPGDHREGQGPALKPASHCVDTLQSFQKSLPQLYKPRALRPPNGPPAHNGSHWEQFCQAREAVAKNISLNKRDQDCFNTWRKDNDKGTSTAESTSKEAKVDQSTDTKSIEEFIRELIRKEFQHLVHDGAEETVSRGAAGVLAALRGGGGGVGGARGALSRVQINGNNKPLLHITFSRSGDNSLHVLDDCVNVTICDSQPQPQQPQPQPPQQPLQSQQSLEETLTDEVHGNSLKRCQAFSAIQEARSTEDLYIDDDLSAQLQDNFGRVKLIPLHGSLHEILCERQGDCCLLKVKQESGCDTVYFRCDNSDTESRDAVDGDENTVVFKRSISLIEERIQRIPKDKRPQTVTRKVNLKTRPKSEVFNQTIKEESKAMSSSSPSLIMKDDRGEEVEVNIENVMCYQDSSSDECLKCRVENDDFELMERQIEQEVIINNSANISSLTCGCLEKISEENLSVLNEEALDKN